MTLAEALIKSHLQDANEFQRWSADKPLGLGTVQVSWLAEMGQWQVYYPTAQKPVYSSYTYEYFAHLREAKLFLMFMVMVATNKGWTLTPEIPF